MTKRNGKPKRVRIFAYARASDPYRQEKSPERQAEELHAKAEQLVKEWYETHDRDKWEFDYIECYQELCSAIDFPFDRRPVFKQILDVIEAGDWLLTWRLDRIDRNPQRQNRAVELLCVFRKVRLFVLDSFDGKALDLNSLQGQLFLSCMNIFAAADHDRRSSQAKATHLRRKANGFPVHGTAPMGHYWVRHAPTDGRSYGLSELKRDKKQWALMWEVHRRIQEGELMSAIAADFERRHVTFFNKTLQCERSWLSAYRRHRYERFYAALHRCEEFVASGDDIPTSASGVPLGVRS